MATLRTGTAYAGILRHVGSRRGVRGAGLEADRPGQTGEARLVPHQTGVPESPAMNTDVVLSMLIPALDGSDRG